MIIGNDAGSYIFLALLAGRPMTDDLSSSMLAFSESYIAFVSLLAEKQIGIN
ncbi:hypothetical protein J2X69_002280 [Algoriphagus sp. 4150]|uniref:hypothetical protein n=1 Tax=Algoriphagus sp. 4150 TaxID=2817756 RepID=UPI002855D4F6|nr:hypothetical protein [Algoriphagus sp. 4150]MDR7129934.1 hypothetical protein [Algoriphagus sp. 4150]